MILIGHLCYISEGIMNYFWSNTIWFLLLGLTTMLEVIYIMVKTDNRKLMFTLFLTMSGAVFIIEVSIYGIFRAYDYYPMIFNNISALDDGLTGNIFSQFSIGATALLISFKNLKNYWCVIFAFIYGGIEELFIVLGIYKHHWYQTWMTVAGFILIFYVLKKIYNKVVNGHPGRFLKYILNYSAIAVPHIFFLSWLFRLFNVLTFSMNKLPDPIVSSMLLFGANYILLVNIILLSYFFNAKWWINGLIIAFFYTAYFIAWQFKFIESANLWILFLFSTLQIFGVYMFTHVFGKIYKAR